MQLPGFVNLPESTGFQTISAGTPVVGHEHETVRVKRYLLAGLAKLGVIAVHVEQREVTAQAAIQPTGTV